MLLWLVQEYDWISVKHIYIYIYTLVVKLIGFANIKYIFGSQLKKKKTWHPIIALIVI